MNTHWCSSWWIVCISLLPLVSSGWGKKESVKLEDVKVLTLYSGSMTTGRRSSPVPQLLCVGGSAGCSAFKPQVVQCYNRGSDGQDVQWECKTDMDNAYRFGHVSVLCEGYDYPDDPYVLKGSCGLEYELDLTREGYSNKKSHDYYGTGQQQQQRSDRSYHQRTENSPSFLSGLFVLAVAAAMIYALYRTCLAPAMEQMNQQSPTDGSDDYRRPGYPSGRGFFQQPSAPPPPGFRSDFTDQGPSSDSCGGGDRGRRGGSSGFPGAGGFWTGAATGGLLGYMLGNRGTGTAYTRPGPQRDYSSNWNWGGASTSRDEAAASSTGTRTASGFGGTRRR